MRPPDGSEPIILPGFIAGRDGGQPLYQQIYTSFRNAILTGQWTAGQRAPSSRALARELQISRLPVLNAYAQLLAEGYLEARPGSGTYIARRLRARSRLRSPIRKEPAQPPLISRQVRRNLPSTRQEATPWMRGWGAFGLHQPALELFPFSAWSKLLSRHVAATRIQDLRRIDPMGWLEFRAAIAEYLRSARGLECAPEQIMVVSGSQQALDIIARTLLNPGQAVWMEEPGYWLARHALRTAGARLVPVAVDEEGMEVGRGMRGAPHARLVYATPAHHFPLGATLSAARRIQLLEWARKSQAWIVEDDYDGEYRYESPPVATLYGMDRQERVIYVGTFSKVMFPSLRLGYIVLPRALVPAMCSVRYGMDIFPPFLSQQVMTGFLRDGHFARHIRRTRLAYRQRRQALIEALRPLSQSGLELRGAAAGLHVSLLLPPACDDIRLAQAAAEEKLWLWPLSGFYNSRQRQRPGFVLGYGSVTPEEMPAAVGQLQKIIQNQ